MFQAALTMDNEERIEIKMRYIHKIAQARGISYQEAYKLAITQEYIKWVDSHTYIDNNDH